MDDLHDETLIIPQAHLVVDLNEFVERVDNPNDPNFCGLVFALASVGCAGNPSINANGNMSTIVTTNEVSSSTLTKKTFGSQRVAMP
jgi:hypothetical protein